MWPIRCTFDIWGMTLEFGIAVKYPDRTLMRTSVAENEIGGRDLPGCHAHP